MAEQRRHTVSPNPRNIPPKPPVPGDEPPSPPKSGLKNASRRLDNIESDSLLILLK